MSLDLMKVNYGRVYCSHFFLFTFSDDAFTNAVLDD